MTSFIETADSRETSVELMEAILKVAGQDEEKAAQIWEEGPNAEELTAIIEIVTKNGMHVTEDFCWGEEGSSWGKADTRFN